MRVLFAIVAMWLILGGGQSPASQDANPEKAANTQQLDERPEDTKAIQALGAAFTQAYGKGEAAGIVDLFTEDAEVTNEAGDVIRGKKALLEHFTAIFKANPGEKIEMNTESIRFFGPDIARETGQTRTTPPGGGPVEVARYTALLVRQQGKWLQASVEDFPETAVSAHDRLKELEWLVGEWVDEDDDGVVQMSCKWSEDKSYLLRDFMLRVGGQPSLSGTQRIGWDPLTSQFKSWVFDPDGGHSEGLWSRNGDREWVIQSRGVLGDGRTVAGTQILTFVRKGEARWRSIDRSIGGEAIPDLPEVTVVRTPPKPGRALKKSK